MKPRRFEQHRSKSSMMCNRFSDFNVKSDKGKTPLIVLRCADNRQLFEGTGKGNGKAMKYAIYEGNLDRLEKKLKRIFNKCKTYGCDFHYEQTGEEFRELKDEKGNKYTARFVLVEAEGTAVINDWEFVAELEHTEKGNIITGVAGIEVPERYYTTTPVCEHCNSKRYRKNTYIVRNKTTGEFKQVGKSCLKDFTHGMSAEAVTQYMSLFDTLIEGETPEPGCSYQRYVNTKEYLSYVAETIRHFGYTRSSDEGISTAIRALDFYDAAHGRAVTKEYLQDLLDKMRSVNFDIDSDLTVKLVSDALAWVSEQEENSNYIHNLKTACSLEYVKGNFGLYASLFPAYDRDLERLDDMKTNACSTGGIDYSAERVQTSPSGDSLCKAVTNYVDFNEQINREIDKFSDAKEQIIRQIRGLHNARYSQVLFKVYVQFKSLKVASGEMGMSYQYVRNLHKKALTRFEETYDDLHYLT